MNHRGGSKRLEAQRRDETHSIVGTPQSRDRASVAITCGAHDTHRERGAPHVWSHRQACLATPTSCRSEEHTSELQSLRHLVCRLLLEKKKKKESTIND